ncbi:RES family NAD+ phosphorylase (plasmid) [Photobacterium damselae]|uniref:RES family NAD+ phosphorylase n=1 Tax=Photobacterium damselae TaxID=38293 RepID=UPI002543CA83
MMHQRIDVFKSSREEKVQDSLGVICSDCNSGKVKDPYIKILNRDFYCEKRCLICCNKAIRGIIVEDLTVLLKYVPKHYKLVDSKTDETRDLKQILSRFTYDIDAKTLTAVDKIAEWVCSENPTFFQKDGQYQTVCTDEQVKEWKREAIKKWDDYVDQLKHDQRFTNTSLIDYYKAVIDISYDQAKVVVDEGTVLYRGRLVEVDNMAAFKKSPDTELSAPPEKYATNSRMSPSGIAFMYMADDPKTVIAELHAYAGDIVAVGTFKCKKDLVFYDFTKLISSDEPESCSLFENPVSHEIYRYKYIIDSLHRLISKPLRANDINYLETQMFAESIRHYNYENGHKFDGIIFSSTQREGHLNYVLFGERQTEGEKTKKTYNVSLDPANTQVKFYRVKNIDVMEEDVTDMQI